MTPTLIANHFIDLDAEGYLTDPMQWEERVAHDIATAHGIFLSDRHWVVVRFMRERYMATGCAPGIRVMGRESGVSVRELYQLFPGGPVRLAAKIGGIPRPKGCI